MKARDELEAKNARRVKISQLENGNIKSDALEENKKEEKVAISPSWVKSSIENSYCYEIE